MKRPNYEKRYYYRDKRIGGRAVKQYIGPEGSTIAQEAAQHDAEQRRAREHRRQQRRTYEACKVELAAVTQMFLDLFRATMTAAGFHQHQRGTWRKRRCAMSKT